MGDFNWHDQLWGGDHISPARQGEANALINYMGEHSLYSLLSRGTKTWQSGDIETTIDLILVSIELAEEIIRCDQTINSFRGLGQLQTDRLMTAVLEAVSKLTLKAKPSPYAKRWWMTDLTQPCRTYTYWRNQARLRRRAGCTVPELEQQAREVAKEYHDTIQKQKKAHWEDFLADDINIWQATKYLKPNVKSDGSTTKDKIEQAEELLTTFFPSLLERIEDEGTQPQREPIHMPDLTMEEIKRKVFEAKL
ncbi:hypothetical protein TSTA_023460 [Talaromyces stipitatus ATCC 10500]|uniref:Endonuclease/exonuclease/phosphatase domain-containing protein n=1 Tax=Talaromyces stipitatus (strain ATCC 10500 / CBS 375.48 / QM 6759 / NRRL 1006) TaxID=441959 RepID=B8M611_TALSN|nr:uncharacterized protein TSTA_023460 [Talaromyces stipitatus ATCC 10500]EED19011.1 hypothetical protein TSTA_023460 [Talaromyces stipitatus ATCC 10500]